jgi:predicted negative regulator of RcsB-dependent stress response
VGETTGRLAIFSESLAGPNSQVNFMKKPLFVLVLVVLGSSLQAQTQSPQQVLAAMEKCREQVISQLSFSEKLKMKAAMGTIQGNPKFVAASKAVSNAPTPEDQIQARRALAQLKLDLIEQQDPSLKPVIDNIRAAQSAVLR